MKVLGIYPNDDGMIYSSKDSPFLFERKATMVVETDGKYYPFNALYISEEGEVRNEVNLEECSIQENYHCIGKKGSTIAPAKLNAVFDTNLRLNEPGQPDILDDALRYFSFDKSKAEDVLKIRFEDTLEKSVYEMKIESDWFGFGTPIYIDMENGFKAIECTLKVDIVDVLTDLLVWYTEYLERDEIKLDIDFAWYTVPEASEEECNEYNLKLLKEREKYLPKLQSYILDDYRGMLNAKRQNNERWVKLREIEKQREKKYTEMYGVF